jgi:hypothetical protein
MFLRLAADLVLRCLLAVSVTAGVAVALLDEGVFLRTEPSARVTESTFGVFTECGALVASNRVPLVVGQTFGWRIEVPDGQSVVWQEQLILPEAPLSWSGSHFIDISDDGTTALTAGADVPFEGVLEHGFQITEGDPAGDYELRLWIDGRLHDRVVFHVE